MAGNGTRYSDREIEQKLFEADALLEKGMKVDDVIDRLGVNKMTYYRWRKVHMETTVADQKEQRLTQLELENSKLKELVADLYLEMRA